MLIIHMVYGWPRIYFRQCLLSRDLYCLELLYDLQIFFNFFGGWGWLSSWPKQNHLLVYLRFDKRYSPSIYLMLNSFLKNNCDIHSYIITKFQLRIFRTTVILWKFNIINNTYNLLTWGIRKFYILKNNYLSTLT